LGEYRGLGLEKKKKKKKRGEGGKKKRKSPLFLGGKVLEVLSERKIPGVYLKKPLGKKIRIFVGNIGISTSRQKKIPKFSFFKKDLKGF